MALPQPEDIMITVKNLLTAQWDNTNTHLKTPEVHIGWIDVQKGNFQIILNNIPDESATGGSSGIYGINPGSGNGIQQMRGFLFVDAYAEEPEEQAEVQSYDFENLAYRAMREIQRIIGANVNTVAGYDYVSFLGFNRRPSESGEKPVYMRFSCRIGYQYRYTTE